MPGCVGTCQTRAEPCWVLRAWLLFVTGSVYFTAGDKTSIRAGLPNGDNQQRDSPIPLFPLPPGWQASGKKSWISHVSACIWDCPTVSCSGETGRMAEAFLLHSLGTQCWLHTSFNPGRKNSKKCNGKKKIISKTQISPNLVGDASCTRRREQAAH